MNNKIIERHFDQLHRDTKHFLFKDLKYYFSAGSFAFPLKSNVYGRLDKLSMRKCEAASLITKQQPNQEIRFGRINTKRLNITRSYGLRVVFLCADSRDTIRD